MRPNLHAMISSGASLKKVKMKRVREQELKPLEKKDIVSIKFHFSSILHNLKQFDEISLKDTKEIDYYSVRTEGNTQANIAEQQRFLKRLANEAELTSFSYRNAIGSPTLRNVLHKMVPTNPLFRWSGLVSLTIWFGPVSVHYLRNLWKSVSRMEFLKLFCIQLRRDNVDSIVLTPEIASDVMNKVTNLEFGSHSDYDHACFLLQKGTFSMERFQQSILETQNEVVYKLALSHILQHTGRFDARVLLVEPESPQVTFAVHVFEEIYSKKF